MNPFDLIKNAFGQLNPQQRQQAAAQMMPPQQNQQQMMGLGPQVASPAQEAAQAAPQTGMFAKFNNHLQDNKSAMMAMASGMMGSPGRPGSIGQGFQNYAAGGQLDEQRRDKAQSKTATEKYLENMTDENGQPRYNPEQIGALVSNPMLLKAELAKKPATLSAAQEKIQRLTSTGMDEDTAIGIADGRMKVSINPMTGERVIIDMANQQIVPLQQPQTQQQSPTASAQPAPKNGNSLYEQAENATGFGATLGRAATDTLGQIPGATGEMFQSPEIVKAQQNFDLFKRNLIQSLSLNPRFPVAEQQRIENLLPTGAFTAPETVKSNLIELDREFQRIEQEAAAGLNNASSTVEQRQADAATLRYIQQARERLGVPQEAGQQGSAQASDNYKKKYGLE